ncbi:hypothetical protein QUB60_10535 [Microcoleus sp. A2-C5]|uniref:hypothetical protein n=1 Tax=Microcoleaceae TaxID=1892252 RepID=UPI002238C68A|nr:hypothetical protein [Lyngbya sp. CCAP 1446/10]MCW6049202.1 hypothetical protein [Lyngbya sp. CCAP 1446/10]
MWGNKGAIARLRKIPTIKVSQHPGLRTRKPYNDGCFDSSASIENLKVAGIPGCI